MEEGTGKGRPGRDVHISSTNESHWIGRAIQRAVCPRVAATKANRQAPTKTKTAKDTLEQPGQDQDCKRGVKEDGKGADARGEVADL